MGTRFEVDTELPYTLIKNQDLLDRILIEEVRQKRIRAFQLIIHFICDFIY